MIRQPIPKLSEDDVLRIARRDFGEERLAEVLSILSRYEYKHARVRVGVLKLAEGDFSRLPECVAKACIDPRDVMMDAEMPNYLYHEKDEARVQEIINRDWQNYCAWLTKE